MGLFEDFKSLIEIFTDKSKSVGTKALYFLLLAIILFVIEFLFNFTYNLHLSSKLSQLEKIQVLKTAYQNDSIRLQQTLNLENQIINRKHYSEFVSFQSLNIFKKSNNIYTPKINKDELMDIPIKRISVSKRTLFWMVLTSNYLLFLFLVGLITHPISDRTLGFKDYLLTLMISFIVIVPIIFISTYLAYFIPLISKNTPIYNYAGNALIHALFFVLFTKWWKKA